MLARVMRAISAAKTAPRASVGITMCEKNGPMPLPIDTRAGLPCRDHAHRDRHEDRDNEGGDGQGYGGLDPLRNQLGDRQVREDRDAEIAMQQSPDPGRELDIERLVESQLLADAGDVVGGRRVSGYDGGGVARA